MKLHAGQLHAFATYYAGRDEEYRALIAEVQRILISVSMANGRAIAAAEDLNA